MVLVPLILQNLQPAAEPLPIPPPVVPPIANNIILIIGDDLGTEQHAAYGSAIATANLPDTSNLEYLGDQTEGIQFNRFYVHPSCSPTRCALATMRYPFRTGVGRIVNNDTVPPMRRYEKTIFEFFKDIGWSTAALGKWHLGNEINGGILSAFENGVDYRLGTDKNLFGLQTYYLYIKDVQGRQVVKEKFLTRDTTDDAIDYITRQYQTGENFFLWLAYNAPHTPYARPPSDSYDTGKWVLADQFPPDPTSDNDYFKANVEALNHEVGRLMEYVDLSNTLVIYIGDNGTSQAQLEKESHPNKGAYIAELAKGSTYEPGIRCPMWMRGAGVSNPNRTTDELFSAVDLGRTILGVAGYTDEAIEAALPVSGPQGSATVRRIVDGLDLKHLIEDVSGTNRDHVFIEKFSPGGPNGGTTTGDRSVISSQYKLRRGDTPTDPDAKTWTDEAEFYDLTDPLNNAVAGFETDPGANLTPGGDTSTLSAAQLAEFERLQGIADDLLATYADDLGVPPGGLP